MSDSDDFDEFYRGTVRRLTQYAYGLTADATEAQDLTHEAYTRAWERWRKIKMYDQPEAWLRVVVTRLATDRWRRLQVRRTAAAAARPPDPAAAPGEDTLYVASLLQKIPMDHRRALALHYLFDMSVEQIATEMNANTNTVKSWLSRGRTALATYIREQEATRV